MVADSVQVIGLFHYLAIAFGLLYTGAALRLINTLPHALSKAGRDWLYVGYLCTTLVAVALNFWDFGSLRSIEWTLPRFMTALARPGAIFFVAAALAPDAPSEVSSWRDHFLSSKSRYFAGMMIVGCLSAAQDRFLLDDVPELSHVLAVLVGMVGMLASRERVLFATLAVFSLYVVATAFGAEATWAVLP